MPSFQHCLVRSLSVVGLLHVQFTGVLTSSLLLAGHADGDTFVNKRHSERLHAAYAGDKNLIMFDGDHNSVRPQFFYSSALIFLHNVLQCPDELNAPTPYDPRAAQDLGM